MKKYLKWFSPRQKLVAQHNASDDPFVKFWIRIHLYKPYITYTDKAKKEDESTMIRMWVRERRWYGRR